MTTALWSTGHWPASRHVALRLLDHGETVVDVPAKLPARMRVYATGQGRKTDDTDAHSVALAGVGMAGLREVVNDRPSRLLRLLADRPGRDSFKIWPFRRALLKTCPPGCRHRPGPPAGLIRSMSARA